MKKIILCALLIVASCIKLTAQKPAVVISDKDGWHKIGETTADLKAEKDEIMVLGADRFAFIKIKVMDAPIILTSFEIYFENGANQKVAIGKEIKAAGETRTVKIEGGERSIKKVSFVYETAPNKKDQKAHLELWGLKTNPDKRTATK
jgi:hypothetical protein